MSYITVFLLQIIFHVAGLYPWTSLISHCCVPNVKIITR